MLRSVYDRWRSKIFPVCWSGANVVREIPGWVRRRPLIAGLSLSSLVLFTVIAVLLSVYPLLWAAGTASSGGQVSRGPLNVSVKASGWVQSGVYNLAFQNATGNIHEIDVRPGQAVRAGQVLARLDPTPLLEAIDTAQTSVTATRHNVAAAYAHVKQVFASVDARTKAAEDAVNASTAHVAATNAVLDSSVKEATEDLESDMNTLDAVRNNASAIIVLAQATLQHQIVVCYPDPATLPTGSAGGSSAGGSSAGGSSAGGSSARPTATPAAASARPTATPTAASARPTATPAAASTAVPTGTPTAAPTLDPYQQLSGATCLQQAYAAYRQSIASAYANVAAALAVVQKDEQAIGRVRSVGIVGVKNAIVQLKTLITVLVTARTDPDRSYSILLVVQAQGQLAQARTALHIAQRNLANATLKAPHAGIVTLINGTVGGPPGFPRNLVPPNSTPTGIFIQLVDPKNIRQVQVDVDETDIPMVQVGEPVQLIIKAYPYRQLSGEINAISPNGVATGSAISYPVFIDIDMQEMIGAILFPNMTSTAFITVLKEPAALRVPVKAAQAALQTVTNPTAKPPFISRAQANDALGKAKQMLARLIQSSPYLAYHKPFAAFVVQPGKQGYQARPVVLGLTDGVYYEVLDGIQQGEQLTF